MNFGRVRSFRVNGLLALMGFVASIAVAIAGTKRYVERQMELKFKAAAYRQRAEDNAFFATQAEFWANVPKDVLGHNSGKSASYYRKLEQKYLQAAKEPWKTVPPDPTEDPDQPSLRPAPVAPPEPVAPPRPRGDPAPRWPDSDPVR